MKLTQEEIKDIANRLDEIIGDHFHDTIYNTILERESDEDIDEVDLFFYITDEDILAIKEQLKRIL